MGIFRSFSGISSSSIDGFEDGTCLAYELPLKLMTWTEESIADSTVREDISTVGSVSSLSKILSIILTIFEISLSSENRS